MLKLYYYMGRPIMPRWLLEEMAEPYELITFDIKKKDQKKPSYLAINPLGKLPALDHDGRIMTEAAAILIYLADLRPEKGFAPALDDPERGRYLTLMVHGPAALEPAIIDKATKRKWTDTNGWGTLKEEYAFVEMHLGDGPWMLGERFTAADVEIGGQLVWATMLKIRLPPKLADYVKRLMARPALAKLFAEQAGG
ncbi:MAG: glutathione S-transferase family protein [Caulobacter sp.]|nr:glutathione S-transferase family protein [Caulobacter sp.]